MSEQNISDLIANNTSLANSLDEVLAGKAAMEKRMGQQISRLRSEAGNKRKSTEMDDGDSPLFEVLRQKLEDELRDARGQNADCKCISSSVRFD